MKTNLKYYSNFHFPILGKYISILSYLILFSCNNLLSQPFVYTNERGDTMGVQWKYDDHLPYVSDELIIKFRKNALNIQKICDSFKIAEGLDSNSTEDEINAIREKLYSEKLILDTVIADQTLLGILKKYGGKYLNRIHLANPCRDTISITRYGDTLIIDFFLEMLLKIDNNNSVQRIHKEIDKNCSKTVQFAEPNYFLSSDKRIDWVKIFYSYLDNTIKIYLINNGREKFKIEIYNYFGELVYEQNNFCFHMDIDASRFHYGIYLVKYIAIDYTTSQLINIFR